MLDLSYTHSQPYCETENRCSKNLVCAVCVLDTLDFAQESKHSIVLFLYI